MIGTKLAVMSTVTATGDPADQVVTICGRERKNGCEFQSRFTGELYHHKKRFDDIGGLGSLLTPALLRNSPYVFPVVEHLLVLDMVGCVNQSLNPKKHLRVTNVAPQERGHLIFRREQARKHLLVSLDQGIIGAENVKMNSSVVGVDDYFDAVAYVIDAPVGESHVPRVGKPVRGGERVHDPVKSTIVTDDDVRVLIEAEEWRQFRCALTYIAAHEQNAVGTNVVGKRDLQKVAYRPGDGKPAEK